MSSSSDHLERLAQLCAEDVALTLGLELARGRLERVARLTFALRGGLQLALALLGQRARVPQREPEPQARDDQREQRGTHPHAADVRDDADEQDRQGEHRRNRGNQKARRVVLPRGSI